MTSLNMIWKEASPQLVMRCGSFDPGAWGGSTPGRSRQAGATITQSTRPRPALVPQPVR